MLTTETVNINSVQPPEDEYGNLYLSRDYSLQENIDYIEELAHSIKMTGLHEPPVLVRDGGIYRIKTGNTRVMAMRKLGIQKFEAIIDESMTAQDVLKLILAAHGSNTKKTYHPVEAGKIDQQLFAFCPDDYIADTMNKPIDEVQRARRGHKRAVEIAGDEAQQLTWEHFAYMDEFADDPEAQNEIINAPVDKLDSVRRNLSNERLRKKLYKEIKDILLPKGVRVADEYQDGWGYEGLIRSPEDAIIEHIQGPKFIIVERPDGIAVYKEHSTSPEADLLKEERDARKAKMEVTKDSRRDFFCSKWPEMPHMRNEVIIMRGEEEYRNKVFYINYSVKNFLEENELEFNPDPTLEMVAAFRNSYSTGIEWNGDIAGPEAANVFTWLTDLLKSEGYVPPQEEEELQAEFDAFLEAYNAGKPEDFPEAD